MRTSIPSFALVLLIAGCHGAPDAELDSIPPGPVVTSTDIDFGVTRPEGHVDRRVTVQNRGTSPLHIVSAEAAAPFFTVTVPSEIPAQGTSDLVLSFRPTEMGQFNASIHLVTESLTTPDLELKLTGFASDSCVLFSPSVVEFPPTRVNDRAVKSIEISGKYCNVSEQVELLSDAQSMAPFSFNREEPDFSFYIVPGKGLFIPVSFEPTSASDQPFTATLEFSPCTTCAPQPITLRGVGVAP